MHHRRLDLHVAVGLHVAANERDDLAALAEDVAHLGVHDEVNVALAVANLAVGEAVELLGQRAQGLGEHRELGRRHGELAAARAQDGAGGAEDVAQVELAEKRPRLLAEHVVAAEELDLAGDVLEHDEGRLALLAKGADAARDAHHVLGVGAVGKLGVALLELAGMRRDRGGYRVGVHARVDEGLAARATHRALVGCGRGRGVVLSHGVPFR